MDTLEKIMISIIIASFLGIVSLVYLGGNGNAIILKETKGIEIPWYYAIAIEVTLTDNAIEVKGID